MSVEIVKTDDKSHTLRNIELDETYHSSFGAIQEAKHIYIDAGLLFVNNNKINVLEIGFGTGLNTLMTYIKSVENKFKINYTSIEKFPIKEEVSSILNYPTLFDRSYSKFFSEIHKVEWGKFIKVEDNFLLKKIHIDLLDYNFLEDEYDVVYFDAFSPQKQPELWTVEIFQKVYNSMKRGGVLTTYCVQGNVKRALKSVGFKIEKLPGPPGKREFIRAVKF